MCWQPTQPLPLRPLCRRYNSSSRHYDAFFLQGLPPRANLTRGAAAAAAAGMPAAAEQAPAVLQYSVLVNQTAIHGLPAAITQAHAALLRWLTGDPSADMRSASHPLPVLPHEQDMRITEAAGKRTCMHPGGNAMQPHGAWGVGLACAAQPCTDGRLSGRPPNCPALSCTPPPRRLAAVGHVCGAGGSGAVCELCSLPCQVGSRVLGWHRRRLAMQGALIALGCPRPRLLSFLLRLLAPWPAQGARQRQQGRAGGGRRAGQRFLGRQPAIRPGPFFGARGDGRRGSARRHMGCDECRPSACCVRRHPLPCPPPSRPQLPAALMVLLFSFFGLKAYTGQRLVAVAVLLWGFAPAALCLTYLLQAGYQVGRRGRRGSGAASASLPAIPWRHPAALLSCPPPSRSPGPCHACRTRCVCWCAPTASTSPPATWDTWRCGFWRSSTGKAGVRVVCVWAGGRSAVGGEQSEHRPACSVGCEATERPLLHPPWRATPSPRRHRAQVPAQPWRRPPARPAARRAAGAVAALLPRPRRVPGERAAAPLG